MKVWSIIGVILFSTAGLISWLNFQGEEENSLPYFNSEEIFDPLDTHVHGSSVVELPNGDLLSTWFEGSGERWADDVTLRGARYHTENGTWTDSFEMANTPGFPDINPVLFIDDDDQLWLFWYTVLANQWETSLPKYRTSTNYMMKEGPPEWDWQEVIHVKPGDKTERGIQAGDSFVEAVKRKAKEYTEYLERINAFTSGEEKGNRDDWDLHVQEMISRAAGKNLIRGGRIYDEDGSYTSLDLGYPLMRRIGWQTYNKPVLLDSGRLILPLYSDGFSNSLMAITDDGGNNWTYSEPLIGSGNIQATMGKKENGDLVAYMRDNGPPPKRMHMSTSKDNGDTWSSVEYSELPNPGSGTDMVTLDNGEWLMVYNNLESGRHSLAVSISADEGKTWSWTRRIELDLGDNPTTSHYPSVVKADDGTIHVTYSHHYPSLNESRHRTIKWAHFNTEWVKEGNKGFALRQDIFDPNSQGAPDGPHVASMVELSNGDLLYSFNAKHDDAPESETKWGVRPASRAYLSRQKSGQQNWTEPSVFARDDKVDIHNTVLWRDDDTLYLFYTTLEGLGHEDSTLDVIVSKDDGETWSEPRTIRNEWGWMFGTRPLKMSNGEVLLPVYKESTPNGAGFIISDDGFETWEVHPSNEDEWPKPGIMASVVELEPGSLLAYLRSSGEIVETRSLDYGRTWSESKETNLPNPYSRVDIIRLENGNLVMAHNPTNKTPRTPLRLSLSMDNGATWPYWVDVETNLESRFDYPYLMLGRNGRIHMGYTHNNKESMRHIVFDEDYVKSGQFLFSDERFNTAGYRNGKYEIISQ